MNMDTLSWKKLNKAVKFLYTRKKFYNQYLYKIEIYAPACRLAVDERESVEYMLARRKIWSTRSSNQFQSEMSNSGNQGQLEYLRYIKKVYKDVIKVRVEEPYISFYSNDESVLYDIARQDPLRRVYSICGPKNDQAEKVLEKGEIIASKHAKYQYKILLRYAKVPINTKIQILDYLDSLGDVVKITPSCRRFLASQHAYWSSYFYCNDPSLVTFISLISPDIISGIYTITKIDQ